MLVLSRKLGEKIVIGENITITVVKLDGAQVRIGIEAPEEIAIYRQELRGDNNEAPKPKPKPEGSIARFRGQRLSNR